MIETVSRHPNPLVDTSRHGAMLIVTALCLVACQGEETTGPNRLGGTSASHCAAEEVRCNGMHVEQCAADGSEWLWVGSCPTRGSCTDGHCALLEETLAPGVEVTVELPVLPGVDLPYPYSDITVALVPFPAGSEPSADEGISALDGVLDFGPDGAVFPIPLEVTVTWPESSANPDQPVVTYILNKTHNI